MIARSASAVVYTRRVFRALPVRIRGREIDKGSKVARQARRVNPNTDNDGISGEGSPVPAHVLDDIRAGSKKSLNAALIEKLRNDLVKGVIEPDVKLKIPAVCERYGVSPGVAREALSRLVPEGLVDFADQRGFRTPPITASSIEDITRVRLLVETEALVDSMEHGDDEWEGRILAALHRLQSCEAGNESDGMAGTDEWSRRHKVFHQELVSACTSDWLIRLHNVLYDQSERYRYLAAKRGNTATGTRRNVTSEHAQMAEAVIARDQRTVLRLLDQHLRRTADRALAAAKLGASP